MKTFLTVVVCLVFCGVVVGQVTPTPPARVDAGNIDPYIPQWQEKLGITPNGGAGLGPYAVIHIPIPPNTVWTDFELKASANNFVDGDMVFFYHSPDPTKSVIAEQIWTETPQVFFTDSGRTGNPNRRAWLLQQSTSIALSLTDADSEVGGIIVIVRDDLSEFRDQLVWTYSLLDGISTDDDSAGRSIWRPVWPSAWITDFNPNP